MKLIINNYFQDFVEIHNDAEYFDPRENKGCTDEEIQFINQLIHPFMIPQIVHKYLKFCGKKYRNTSSLFQSIVKAQQMEENKEFFKRRKFLILEYSPEGSVYCGIKTDDLHLDNPPYYICESGILKEEEFTLRFDYFIGPTLLKELQDSFIKEGIYYEENKTAYEIKQLIIEMYDILEKDNSIQTYTDISNQLRRLCVRTRSIALSKSNCEDFVKRIERTLSMHNDIFTKSEDLKLLKDILILKLNLFSKWANG